MRGVGRLSLSARDLQSREILDDDIEYVCMVKDHAGLNVLCRCTSIFMVRDAIQNLVPQLESSSKYRIKQRVVR